MDHTELLPIIDKIYDTALAPENWEDVLLDLADFMGASGAIIFEVLEGTQRLIAPHHSTNYSSANIRAYLDEFGDFEFQNQIEFAKMANNQNDIELVNDLDVEAHIDDERMRLARRNLKENYNLGHRTGTILNKDSWNIDRLSLQYDLRRGPATDDEKELGKMIFPHVAKALRIGRPLTPVVIGAEEQFRTRFDRLDFGVALITEAGEVLFNNIEFSRILEQSSEIRLSDTNKLEIRQDNLNRNFRRLISSIELHASSGARPRSQALTVTSGEHGDIASLFIEISPTNYHEEFGRLPHGSKLVTCLDVSRGLEINTDIVNQFFKLSKSERSILPLVAKGFSNAEIAQIRSRSIETINTQTKTLLRKTHTRNRTELVQLSLALKSPFSMAWL